MEIHINHYPENAGISEEPQTLPANTKVEFVSRGTVFSIRTTEDGNGIEIRQTRKSGIDAMLISPQFSNSIEIR